MDVRDDLIEGYRPGSFRKRKRVTGRQVLSTIMLAALILLVLYYGLEIQLGQPLAAQTQVIAHRGGPAYAPENTLAAFRQAIADGVDWLEFDVQMTSDGELVVIHDTTVDRTTDGTGAVADMTLAQIQALDAGEGERIPTFAEVIDVAKAAGVGILPEAKSPELYPGIEQAMVDAIVKAGYLDKTIVQSFVPETLDTFHEINPDLQLCALYGQGVLTIKGQQPGEAAYICPMAEMAILNPSMIRGAHAEGHLVFVWFGLLENKNLIRMMLWLGADGVMVNDPLAMKAVMGQ